MADESMIIGRKEHVALPEWGIARMRAKVDTGARTSALDVLDFELRKSEDGRTHVRFQPALRRKHQGRERIIEAEVIGFVIVRNTGGDCEQRPMIQATIRLGPVTQRTRLTLTKRTSLRHRMIIGRRTLRGRFIVDVSKKYLLDG
jgi:hypothetical protein